MTRRKDHKDHKDRKHRWSLSTKLVLAGIALIGVCMILARFGLSDPEGEEANAREPRSNLRLEDIPFGGQRSYEYLKQICALGPRISGTPGMEKQRKLVTEHFERLGADVHEQRFRVRHPLNGSLVTMANLIIQWHPKREERIVLCAHYDTRPLPDRDRNPRLRREGIFLGANDGASGVALLMEMGHLMADLECNYGVDFVLFDGEELVYDGQRDRYFLGSEWFSRKYVSEPPDYRYRWGVLLDMIGDSNLQIYQEKNSMFWKDTRPLVVDIWKTAARLGVREFIPRRKHEVRDDHLKLHDIAKIPTCDIIDFDYPAWHTTGDVPRKCSALSLAKVGWVVHEWLRTVK